MSHVVIQPHPSSCDLKTLVTTQEIVFLYFDVALSIFLLCVSIIVDLFQQEIYD